MTDNPTRHSLTTKADKWVIAASLLLIVFLYVSLWRMGEGQTNEVEIGLPGGQLQHIDLSHDGRYQVSGRLGDSVIEVLQGRVRFIDSPCSNKVCVRSGWLEKSGGFSACLPNGISLFLAAGEQFDGINF